MFYGHARRAFAELGSQAPVFEANTRHPAEGSWRGLDPDCRLTVVERALFKRASIETSGKDLHHA